jgi:rubrerythrin
MAERVSTGSDMSARTYRCTKCGQTIDARSIDSLPPCPSCNNTEWESLIGGDSVDDPYPNRS